MPSPGHLRADRPRARPLPGVRTRPWLKGEWPLSWRGSTGPRIPDRIPASHFAAATVILDSEKYAGFNHRRLTEVLEDRQSIQLRCQAVSRLLGLHGLTDAKGHRHPKHQVTPGEDRGPRLVSLPPLDDAWRSGQCSLQTRAGHSGLPSADGGNHPTLRHSPGHRRCPAVSSSSMTAPATSPGMFPNRWPQPTARYGPMARPGGWRAGPKPAAREMSANPAYSATKPRGSYISPPTAWRSGGEWTSCTLISADEAGRKAGNCRAAPHGVGSRTLKPPLTGTKWPLWTHAIFRGPSGCLHQCRGLPVEVPAGIKPVSRRHLGVGGRDEREPNLQLPAAGSGVAAGRSLQPCPSRR